MLLLMMDPLGGMATAGNRARESLTTSASKGTLLNFLSPSSEVTVARGDRVAMFGCVSRRLLSTFHLSLEDPVVRCGAGRWGARGGSG